MSRQIIIILTTILISFMVSCKHDKNEPTAVKSDKFEIPEADIDNLIRFLKENDTLGYNAERIEKGVKQVAKLWQESDGSIEDYTNFCKNQFITDSNELKVAYNKLERNFEILYGLNNQMSVKLLEPLHLDMGKIHWIDEVMGAYSPSAHLSDDLFKNKIAHYVALNFPAFTLKEKMENAAKWDRLAWAYARMGDVFVSRNPAELEQQLASAMTNADTYIADYNIYMGKIVDEKMQTLFPKDMKLITHWGLRDELKSNYNAENGLQKQQLIYDIMLRIIRQEIPQEVINKNDYQWNPNSNKLYKDDKEVAYSREQYTRYEHLLLCFKSNAALDPYNPIYPSFIERAYDESMEITSEDVEKLFIEFLSAPEIAEVAKIIKTRLNRDLQPFDIWYDGFKSRTNINESDLDAITRKKYPNAKAFENDIARILQDLGWTRDKAIYISNKISVDPARGAGHAWGAEAKWDKAHLRTRVSEKGMDYKAYNIAIHELGHNVEQTITLYDMDYYMLKGVPNTAFTEAVAFLFQSKDLKLLKSETTPDKHQEALAVLDNCWSIYEIMGVSLVDMYIWKWMYQNPDCNAKELQENVERIAIEVWNKYYYPIFGVKDSPILAIYSHIITSPLYLANYPVGHIIEFQVEQFVKDKHFANEITRMLELGRLTPQEWLRQALNSELSTKGNIVEIKKAIKAIK